MLDTLEKLYLQQDLSTVEAQEFFKQVVSGNVDPIILSAALVALKIKGERAAEIAGAAQALRDSALAFPAPDYDYIDCVGTGGDGHHTINVSTTAAIVAASMGVKVAKHGNRSVSSKSGSADLLEAFGVNLTMTPDVARQCLDKTNLTFLYAPAYHSGIKHAMPVRQTLKTRTLFNILGPLVNPATPPLMIIGVYHPDLLQPFAEALKLLGTEKAWVVHGSSLDEIAPHDVTRVKQLKDGVITELELSPNSFGLPSHSIESIKGGSPEDNAGMVRDILNGKGVEAHIDAVAANTAAMLVVTQQYTDLSEAAAKVKEHLSTGKAIHTLEAFVEVSNG